MVHTIGQLDMPRNVLVEIAQEDKEVEFRIIDVTVERPSSLMGKHQAVKEPRSLNNESSRIDCLEGCSDEIPFLAGVDQGSQVVQLLY